MWFFNIPSGNKIEQPFYYQLNDTISSPTSIFKMRTRSQTAQLRANRAVSIPDNVSKKSVEPINKMRTRSQTAQLRANHVTSIPDNVQRKSETPRKSEALRKKEQDSTNNIIEMSIAVIESSNFILSTMMLLDEFYSLTKAKSIDDKLRNAIKVYSHIMKNFNIDTFIVSGQKLNALYLASTFYNKTIEFEESIDTYYKTSGKCSFSLLKKLQTLIKSYRKKFSNCIVENGIFNGKYNYNYGHKHNISINRSVNHIKFGK